MVKILVILEGALWDLDFCWNMAGDWNELQVLVELAKHCMGIWCLVDFTINSGWYWGNCTEFSLSLILTDWDMLWINLLKVVFPSKCWTQSLLLGGSQGISKWGFLWGLGYPVPGTWRILEKQQMGMQHLQSYSKSIATYYPFKHNHWPVYRSFGDVFWGDISLRCTLHFRFPQ